MYLKKIEALSRYLVANDSRSDEICRFLNFEIFDYLQSRAIFFARLSNEAVLSPVGHYGFPEQAVSSWGSFPLTVNLPITAAVSRNTCIQVNSHKEMIEQYPIFKDLSHTDSDWGSLLAVPVHAYGVYSIVSYAKPEMSDEHDGFLRTIGQLASIGFSKSHLASLIDSRKKVGRNGSFQKSTLTPRQELIKKLILRGMTNTEIGSEIGFSESLIRQETMSIYAALGVSGRKELLANVAEE
jgi:DNA-binding CsgD family transcriptional regulator